MIWLTTILMREIFCTTMKVKENNLTNLKIKESKIQWSLNSKTIYAI